jgi:hypothetical protein
MGSDMVVILIGFDYFNSSSSTLLGMLSDIKSVYDYFNQLKPKKIIFLTDLEPGDNIKKGFIDPNLIIFINKTREFGEYFLLENKSDLIKIISQAVKNQKKIVFYYTGHAKSKKIILPDEKFSYIDDINFLDEDINSLEFSFISELIQKESSKKSQILFILDCCHSDGMNLPFSMDLKKGIYYIKNEITKIPTQEIVCISASLSNQTSFSDITGSIFTKELMKKFRDSKQNKRNCSYISWIKEIGFKKLNHYFQTFNVFSSRPNLKKPWHWLFCTSQLKIKTLNGVLTINK